MGRSPWHPMSLCPGELEQNWHKALSQRFTTAGVLSVCCYPSFTFPAHSFSFPFPPSCPFLSFSLFHSLPPHSLSFPIFFTSRRFSSSHDLTLGCQGDSTDHVMGVGSCIPFLSLRGQLLYCCPLEGGVNWGGSSRNLAVSMGDTVGAILEVRVASCPR